MTTKSSSTIEINGKRYNARTGEIVDSASKIIPKPIQKPLSVTNRSQPIKPMPVTNQALRRVSDISRATSATSRPKRAVDKSHTLMRQAVKRPAVKPTVKSTSMSHSSASPIQPSTKPKIILSTEQEQARYSRARATKQNALVSKFGNQATRQAPASKSAITQKRSANISVKPAPSQKSPAIARSPLSTQKKPLNYPVTKVSKAESIIAKSLKDSPSQAEKLSRSQKKSIKSQRKFGRKLISYGAGTLAMFMLASFYLYQNIPSITMRYAKARSGIYASLPSYKPSGFSLSNKIEYNPGQVKLNFASNSDSRNFTITQKESTWDSQSLLSSYISTMTDRYQKFENKGRTIYLYDDGSATWVNGGIWYDISGNSELSPDQLIQIASSM